MQITVKVTQRDIKKAKELLNKGYNRCLFCPIGLALKRVLTDNISSVTAAGVGMRNCMPYSLPNKAVLFISDFDNGKKVEPMEFELKIPKVYIKEEVLLKEKVRNGD